VLQGRIFVCACASRAIGLDIGTFRSIRRARCVCGGRLLRSGGGELVRIAMAKPDVLGRGVMPVSVSLLGLEARTSILLCALSARRGVVGLGFYIMICATFFGLSLGRWHASALPALWNRVSLRSGPNSLGSVGHKYRSLVGRPPRLFFAISSFRCKKQISGFTASGLKEAAGLHS